MVDRSTAPLEMFGEPDDTECPHGIPTGMGVECWECRYDQLKIDYDALEQECGELAERAQELADKIAVDCHDKYHEELVSALKAASVFIRNGIELGFIRMPDKDTPDPAHLVPGMIEAALAKAEGVKEADHD